jgi:hypothetical protein
MSLYTDLIDAGIECHNWQSDLYFPKTEETQSILDKHPQVSRSVFIDEITANLMYECPFQFDLFWAKKA